MKKNKVDTVFIVETEKTYSFMLNPKLPRNSGIEISSFSTAGECLQHVLKKPSVILLDYKLVNKQVQKIHDLLEYSSPGTSIIILLEPDDLSVWNDLPKEVYFDFLVKDKDSSKLTDMLIQRIMNSIKRLESKNRIVRQKVITIYVATAILLTLLILYYFR